MAAFNFKARFAPHIRSGRKHHTIRADRKDGRRPKPGEQLYLFCGMRTKQCERLMEPTCTRVSDISIPEFGMVLIDEEPLDQSEKESLAFHDGFESFAEMMEFWAGRFPFTGFITYWRPL